MKAISLWQPYATLIAIGVKSIETRSWPTPYRGPLIIHAAKKCNGNLYGLALSEPFITHLVTSGYKRFTELPFGAYVCVVDLIDVLPTDAVINSISDDEYAFGNYNKGRFAWKLENVRILPEPVPARGYQRLWNPLEGINPAMDKLIKEMYGG